MNTTHTPSESATLGEPDTDAATRTPARRPRHVRRWALGLAAAGAAAATVVVSGLGGGTVVGPSPAYAVDVEETGEVVVTIHRLEDSAGLEAALAAEGIDAQVNFAQPMEDEGIITIPGGRVDEIPPGGSVQLKMYVNEDAPPCSGFGDPATLTHEGDAWVLHIPADNPAQDKPVDILTSAGGGLVMTYPGDRPGVMCSVAPDLL